MSTEKFCIYIRVSTKKQEASGLGLEAQKKICSEYIANKGGEILKEFQDIESGTHRDRPGLWAAVEYCKSNKCTLVIAKLDRLARDVEFVFKIVNSGIQIAFVDMPVISTVTLGIFATVAQYERDLISGRTKSALGTIKDNIAKNGGHFSKSGNYIRKLGAGKNLNQMPAALASGKASRKRAQDWRSTSPLYKWVERQVRKGRRQKDILDEARELYDSNPTIFCTRTGKKLTQGLLSFWMKEMHPGI